MDWSIQEFVWEEVKLNMINNEEKLYTEETKIPESEFALIHNEENIHDTKFETRPVGWFEDSLRRFAKNPASVVGFVLIMILALFSIIVPIVSPFNHFTSDATKFGYPGGFNEKAYADLAPKLFPHNGGFWDGTEEIELNASEYFLKSYTDANEPYILSKTPKEKLVFNEVYNRYDTHYIVRVDTYAVGVKEQALTVDQFNAIVEYENAKGISYATNPNKSVLKPQIDYEDYIENEFVTLLEAAGITNITNAQFAASNYYNTHPSVFFKIFPKKKPEGTGYNINQFEMLPDAEGNVQPVYLKDSGGNYVFYPETGDHVRVDFNAFFKWAHGKNVMFVFGSNAQGRDLFTRLAEGGRFSLLLGIGITFINFIIGLIWGAISGYYGGKIDLIMERVVDVIANIPTIIIMSLCSIQIVNNTKLSATIGQAGIVILALFIAFIYNGWVGVAGTTRMQFYRYKNQEYVLASRTLGAKDRRLIFKHILPNAAGTLVTRCVLMIPGVIFAESSLSYLGIINFDQSGISSIGALLNEGKGVMQTTPHLLLFPAITVAILMISYNLFGNGLRDAFNTTLRGSED